MKQGTWLKAKTTFTMKAGPTRKTTVREGALFWVTSPEHVNVDSIDIARKGKNAADCWRISLANVYQLFTIEG